MMLARDLTDHGAMAWCREVVADDGNFIACERDGVFWHSPVSFTGHYGFVNKMFDLVNNVSLSERQAAGHATALYDGPGGTEVPTPRT
jgi:hypothetical protein